MDSYKKIVQDTINIVSFHSSIGIEEYPLTEGITELLRLPLNKASQDLVVKKASKKSNVSPQRKEVDTTISVGSLSDIRAELGECTRCSLEQSRSTIIFGSGNPKADLFIIGEWPNRLEDQTGELFTGAEGQMLDNMLTHVLNLSRNEVYLSSLIKCRVPDNGHPAPQHIQSCKPFILSQLAAVQPKVVCTMGPLAAQALLNTNKPLIRLRGHFHQISGMPLMPTFHPSYLIKNPEMKKATMHDLQMIKKKLAER